ncbi:hypothetical protein [Pelagibacterium halotolerans]|uniref:hypothetical protein n=1 Tax=Pelagibacterium halotolerans TaxID=531813 RepID=UPI003850E301
MIFGLTFLSFIVIGLLTWVLRKPVQLLDDAYVRRGKMPPFWKARAWLHGPLWGYRRSHVLPSLVMLGMTVSYAIWHFGSFGPTPRIWRADVQAQVNKYDLIFQGFLSREPDPASVSSIEGEDAEENTYPLPRFHLAYDSVDHTVLDVAALIDLFYATNSDGFSPHDPEAHFYYSRILSALGSTIDDLERPERLQQELYCFRIPNAQNHCRLSLTTSIRRMHEVQWKSGNETERFSTQSALLVRPILVIEEQYGQIAARIAPGYRSQGRISCSGYSGIPLADCSMNGFFHWSLGAMPFHPLRNRSTALTEEDLSNAAYGPLPLQIAIGWPQDLDGSPENYITRQCREQDAGPRICAMLPLTDIDLLELGEWMDQSGGIYGTESTDAPSRYVFSDPAERFMLGLFLRTLQDDDSAPLPQSAERDRLVRNVVGDYVTVMGNIEASPWIAPLLDGDIPDSADRKAIAAALGRQPHLRKFYSRRDVHADRVYAALYDDLKAFGLLD